MESELINTWVERLTLLGMVATIVYTHLSLAEIRKENKIKNRLDAISQICLGILNPEGIDLPINNDDFRSISYYRIKNIGNYDGVRAFLGEMMKFPSLTPNEQDDGYKQRKTCYVYGPQRYGLSWRYLIVEFRRICKLMGVESGLEEFEKKYKKECHSNNFVTKEAEEYIEKYNLMTENISATSGSVTSCQLYAGSILEVLEETRRLDSEIPKKKKRKQKNKYNKKQ